MVAAVSMCFSGVCDVYLLCKCGVKTAKCGAKTVKMWCIFGVYMLDFLYFGCQGGEMVVRLRGLVVWLRGFRVWFLYDLVADATFGNL